VAVANFRCAFTANYWNTTMKKVLVLLLIVCVRLNSHTLIPALKDIPSVTGAVFIIGTSTEANPALVCLSDSLICSIGFSPSRFGLKELSASYISLVTSLTDDIYSSFAVNYCGNEIFSELETQTVFGLKITDDFAIASAFDLSSLSITDYPNHLKFDTHIGAILAMEQNFQLGAGFNNIFRGAYEASTRQSVSRTATMGLGYRIMPELSIEIGSSIDFDAGAGITLSSLYNYENIGTARFALCSNPRSAELSAYLSLLGFASLGVSVYYHDWLGFTQTIWLNFY
jgi:hypothetical protein